MVLPLFNPLSAEISQMKLVPNKRDAAEPPVGLYRLEYSRGRG